MSGECEKCGEHCLDCRCTPLDIEKFHARDRISFLWRNPKQEIPDPHTNVYAWLRGPVNADIVVRKVHQHIYGTPESRFIIVNYKPMFCYVDEIPKPWWRDDEKDTEGLES